jgi:murein DD-endopeptidase MepM/ murein hydrolase activator NlpD
LRDWVRLAAAFAVAAVLSVAGTPTHALYLSLDGIFKQGGMATGKVYPGARVRLDGKDVPVARDGAFVIGFGRDAPPEAVVEIEAPDGRRETHRYAIEKRSYRIQRIEGLPPKMVTPSPEALKRIRAEGKLINEARGGFTQVPHYAAGFVWPAKGSISGVYGSQRILNGEPRRPHLGVDIAAPVGTPVVASAAGTVTLANRDLYFTGGTIIIDHGHGLSTVYSHLSAVSVKTGQTVKRGQPIGKLGSTGRSTGPHLDWRINWFQERLDPMLIAGPMPKG